MIEGFEEQTKPLSDYEKKMVPGFVTAFSTRIGKENAISSEQIISGVKKTWGIDINGARVRKIVNHIRINGLVKRLVASSKGYYIENDDKELIKYLHSLAQRKSAIEGVLLALNKQLNETR